MRSTSPRWRTIRSVAVVTAAHPGNVDTVLVDGRAVKRGGRLLYENLGGVLAEAHRATERLGASSP